jgi:hypothetical protein
MQAINHTLTAGVIALTVKQPELVAPLALASHFALDMIPHYYNVPPWKGGSKRRYYNTIYLDAALTLGAYIAMIKIWPSHSGVISLAVFLAIAPDFFWAIQRKVAPQSLIGRYLKWHKAIQWSESAKGIIVEILWCLTSLAVLANLV